MASDCLWKFGAICWFNIGQGQEHFKSIYALAEKIGIQIQYFAFLPTITLLLHLLLQVIILVNKATIAFRLNALVHWISLNALSCAPSVNERKNLIESFVGIGLWIQYKFTAIIKQFEKLNSHIIHTVGGCTTAQHVVSLGNRQIEIFYCLNEGFQAQGTFRIFLAKRG